MPAELKRAPKDPVCNHIGGKELTWFWKNSVCLTSKFAFMGNSVFNYLPSTIWMFIVTKSMGLAFFFLISDSFSPRHVKLMLSTFLSTSVSSFWAQLQYKTSTFQWSCTRARRSYVLLETIHRIDPIFTCYFSWRLSTQRPFLKVILKKALLNKQNRHNSDLHP